MRARARAIGEGGCHPGEGNPVSAHLSWAVTRLELFPILLFAAYGPGLEEDINRSVCCCVSCHGGYKRMEGITAISLWSVMCQLPRSGVV